MKWLTRFETTAIVLALFFLAIGLSLALDGSWIR